LPTALTKAKCIFQIPWLFKSQVRRHSDWPHWYCQNVVQTGGSLC
jgi:hypothetical protein